jgi:hypothetical protein
MDEDITSALAAAHKAPTQPAVVAVAAHQATPAVAAAVQPPNSGEATRQHEQRRDEARPQVSPTAGVDVTV